MSFIPVSRNRNLDRNLDITDLRSARSVPGRPRSVTGQA